MTVTYVTMCHKLPGRNNYSDTNFTILLSFLKCNGWSGVVANIPLVKSRVATASEDVTESEVFSVVLLMLL